MRKLIYIIGSFLIILHTSCGDFLEPKSNTEYNPEEVEGLNEMLLGVSYPSATSTGFFGFTSILDDDVTARPYVATPASELTSYYLGSNVISAQILYGWTDDYENETIRRGGATGSMVMYRNLYKFIVGANAALDYVDAARGSENDKRNVRAQAYALRALFYFQLTNIYGAPYITNPNALGVPLKLTSQIEEGILDRNTVRECYEQIVSDLLASIKNYTEMGDSHTWSKNYRTSLPMAQLLLSRVCMYMGEWEKAAQYAQMVINNGQFSLYDLNDYNIPTPSSSQYNYLAFTSYNYQETIWLFGNPRDLLSYNVQLLGTATASHPALFNASSELLASYEEKTSSGDDLRKGHYIVGEKYQYVNGLKRAYGKIAMDTYSTGRWPLSGSAYFGSAFRLSEAYLNYAEAHAMMKKEGIAGGSTEEALSALNTLREKRIAKARFVNLTTTDFATPDELVGFARNERRRELCFEGHRWFDLKRYGMPEIKHLWYDDSNQTGTELILSERGSFYAIPIPPSIRQENTNLDPNTWQ